MTHYYRDIIIGFPLISLAFVSTYSTLSNPFGVFNRVKNPYRTELKKGEFQLRKKFVLKEEFSVFWRTFAFAKCGWHIISNVRGGSKARSRTPEGIIRDIHRLRFNPEKPYLISGDHFNVFYPRNLGVFYASLLDSRIALDKNDWHNKQRIYLQSAAYALAAFRRHGDCTTTIVPIGPKSICCINIYRYPSDALYGVLYALSSLADNSHIEKICPFDSKENFDLNTRDAAAELFSEYSKDLSLFLKKYLGRVYDIETGLIKKDLQLSSAKDAVKRSSSFYDNVILWKTLSLAKQLGVKIGTEIDPAALKERILKNFWHEERGYFLEDLSEDSLREKFYSADWLATCFTGFLDPAIENERKYLERSVDFTIEKKIDMPFPLRYQEADRKGREVFLVRLFVPAYGGSGIWSFWGSEFIKLLLILDNVSGTKKYADRAHSHIETYQKNMVRYHGYPEIYDSEGNSLRTLFYRSIRQTGWVVSFEQALALEKKRNSLH